jgi:hypothetical protein
MAMLERYSWPGNIRELRNVIERAVLLCAGGPIGLEHLPVEKMRATMTQRPAAPRSEPAPPPAPPPPPPPPEKPSVSFAFKGDDFLNPQLAPMLMSLLQMATSTEPPPPGPAPQPEHGGPMTPGTPINQHSAGHSGGLPNAPGAMARAQRIHPSEAESGPPGPTAPGVGRLQ